MGRKSRRPYAWNGINIGQTAPADTNTDLFYIHIPNELSDDDVTLIRIIGRISVENLDVNNNSLRMGVTIFMAELDDLGVSTTDIDPLGLNLEDFARKNVLWHKRVTFRGSGVTNNYWRDWEVDVSAKRKLTQTRGIAVAIKGNVANDWQYEGQFRGLFQLS